MLNITQLSQHPHLLKLAARLQQVSPALRKWAVTGKALSRQYYRATEAAFKHRPRLALAAAAGVMFAVFTLAQVTVAVAQGLRQPHPAQPTPETFYLRPLPDTIRVRRHYPLVTESGQQHHLRVLPYSDKADASIFFDGQELIHLRPTPNLPQPYQQALKLTRALHQQLATGKSPAKLAVVETGSMAHLQFGDLALMAIDQQQALAASVAIAQSANHNNSPTPEAKTPKAITPLQLATTWQKNMDTAFGVDRLTDQAYVATGVTQTGEASWYGPGFHGRLTANGERYDMHGISAAHKTLPFGTLVRVTNQWTQKQIVVRINDRGPYAHGRIIDLSKGAAEKIGLTGSGVAPVVITVVTPNTQGAQPTNNPELAMHIPNNGLRLPIALPYHQATAALPIQEPVIAAPAVALPSAAIPNKAWVTLHN